MDNGIVNLFVCTQLANLSNLFAFQTFFLI